MPYTLRHEAHSEENDMKTLAVVGLARLCGYGTRPKTSAERGGVLVFVWNGWVCMKPPGKIPIVGTKP